MTPDFYFGLTPGDLIYDIETYPNYFLINITHAQTGQRWSFEISDRKHEGDVLQQFFATVRDMGCRMVGFNNLGFDYPVIHFMYQNLCRLGVKDIYDKAMRIINTPWEQRFGNIVRESDWFAQQVDLFKIHHFDNQSKSTSLKVLEFNMHMDDIEDLPFPVGTELTDEQKDVVCEYCWHDIKATRQFYDETLSMIQFREVMSEKLGKNFLNHNDTKIGKDYFTMELEKQSPGCCYRKVDGRKKPVQTLRPVIDLNDAILPMVHLKYLEFNHTLDWIRSQRLTETKGVFKQAGKLFTDKGVQHVKEGMSCVHKNFQFDFGTGGIHGSVKNKVVREDDDRMIIDLDVASYYPNLAIANHLFPAHFGQGFCDIYQDLYQQRKKFKKGSPENAMLKLALNGVYGDSNNKYSPFYDPLYTMSITMNGQLLLCMLAEALMESEAVEMIQVNTDGLTIRVPRHLEDWVNDTVMWWESATGLQLEAAEYKAMYIRDVNSYLALYTNGKVKRKGAYAWDKDNPDDPKELEWHQNHSALAVPKAAEQVLIHGADPEEYIENFIDVFDFMLRAKVDRSSLLEWGGDPVQGTSRYYISTDGDFLEKIMPPKGTEGEYKRASKISNQLFDSVMAEVGPGVWDERIHTKNKSQYGERRTGYHTGWTVRMANSMEGLTFNDINYEWYINEVVKLTTLEEM